MTRLINIELTVKWSSLQWLTTFGLRCRRPFYGGSYPGGGIYAGERRCLFTTYDLVRNTWSPLVAAEGTDHDYFPLEAIAAFYSLVCYQERIWVYTKAPGICRCIVFAFLPYAIWWCVSLMVNEPSCPALHGRKGSHCKSL